MASTFTANIPEDFDVEVAAQDLEDRFQTKGYTARTVRMKKGARVVIEKGKGGLNTILGMTETITVTLTKHGDDQLIANFSNAEWTSKVIGFVVGMLCCIPFITAIIGTIRQISLPGAVENELTEIISGD